MTADTAPDTTRADTDTAMMDEALALAERAAGRTSPNPLVGAVVVRDGQVVGRGFHAGAGEPHAEVLALRDAGARTRGATVYVSLEPCDHIGRTAPCTDVLIAAGIRRVVVAMQDPDPQVNGRGIARLREAGIEVQVGLREERARRLNEFFIKHRQTGLPFVTLKWAMSLDGRIAARRGSPTAITGTAARQHVHGLRNVYDAVMIGVGTVLADDPLLTCRLPAGTVPSPRHPLRIIVDSRLRTPSRARAVTGVHEAPALIATTQAAPPDRIDAMRRAGVEVVVQEQVDARVDLRALMATLGGRGILSVLVEGGAEVAASALSAGVADKVIAIVAPRVIGGDAAPSPVEGARLPGPIRLRDVRVRHLDEDIVVEGYLAPAPEQEQARHREA